jgi:hypothetical protein
MSDDKIPIQPGDLSDELILDIHQHVSRFSAPLFAVGDGSDKKVTYCGGSTCVGTKGNRYLLTAAHVWRTAQEHKVGENKVLGIAIGDDRFMVAIPTRGIEPVLFPARPLRPAEGPDLAFLKLPEVSAHAIAVEKAFYNLDNRRAAPKPEYDRGLWGVHGAPQENATLETKRAILRMTFYGLRIERTFESEGFDYVDLAYDREDLPALPESYGGVSGSGLWNIRLSRAPDSGTVSWDGSPMLEGVAFFQDSATHHQGLLRCHGRRSIYENI